MINLPDLGEYKVVIVDEPDAQDFPDCIREEWFLDGVTHRGGDEPAVTVKSKSTGDTLHREWYKNGELHRENDQPAIIGTEVDGGSRVWYKEGQTHREYGPAVLLESLNKAMCYEERWIRNGKLHRIDGPAVMLRNPDTGIIEEESWYLNDQLSRSDGPAIIFRNDDGSIYSQGYFRDGQKQPSSQSLETFEPSI